MTDWETIIRKRQRDAMRKHHRAGPFQLLIGAAAVPSFLRELERKYPLIPKTADELKKTKHPVEFLGMPVWTHGTDFDVWVVPVDEKAAEIGA